MEIFNIGPLELIFILVLALIVLGPEGMIKTARDIAKGLRKFIRSPIWKSLVTTTQEIRELPRKFIRESGLEEGIDEMTRLSKMPDITLPPLDDSIILPGKKIALDEVNVQSIDEIAKEEKTEQDSLE